MCLRRTCDLTNSGSSSVKDLVGMIDVGKERKRLERSFSEGRSVAYCEDQQAVYRFIPRPLSGMKSRTLLDTARDQFAAAFLGKMAERDSKRALST
ncbi:hypothetical protein RRG08_020727 [Elysia crispata]|uniref:Uncharacterized protein n=1 Tax=Elysia crispata TaxID=231223 RepID=A0AAE0Z6K8_9GAST|nr:hypothetical protein RRG08_020727 [Elysia crispata]